MIPELFLLPSAEFGMEMVLKEKEKRGRRLEHDAFPLASLIYSHLVKEGVSKFQSWKRP